MITISNEQGLRLSWNCNVFFFITFLHISRHSKSFGANFRFCQSRARGQQFLTKFFERIFAQLRVFGVNSSFSPITTLSVALLQFVVLAHHVLGQHPFAIFFPQFLSDICAFRSISSHLKSTFRFHPSRPGAIPFGGFLVCIARLLTFHLFPLEVKVVLQSALHHIQVSPRSINKPTFHGRTDGWTDSSMDRGCGRLE